MTISNLDELSEMHIDILREIGNIGAGNAATSLSQMLNKKVDMNVPEVRLLDFQDATELMGGPETVVLGILVKMTEDIEGMVMFILKKEFVSMIINSLIGIEVKSFDEIGEMEFSALQEVGNIMIASFINSIAGLTGLTIDISVPALTIDYAGALLSVPAIEFANVSDKVIFIEEKFKADRENVDSQILLIPDVKSLNKLLTGLGIEI